MMDASTVRMCLSPVLCHSNMSPKKNLTDYSHFSLFRPYNVESLMSVPLFRAKCLLLTQLLCRAIQLISIYHHCPGLDYTGISDMETILCNIYLALSGVLYNRFKVRNMPIDELILPAQCVASVRDLCHTDIDLVRVLMQILLNFNDINLHRCGLLISLKGNITFWLTHLRHYLRVHNLL